MIELMYRTLSLMRDFGMSMRGRPTSRYRAVALLFVGWLCAPSLITATESSMGAPESEARFANDRNLLQASSSGKLDHVQAMLQHGSDPNMRSRDRNGRSALILATMGGHIEVIEVLLGAGANINQKDTAGLAPLSWAIMRGQNYAAELLLQRGADVNALDENGVSPLMYAIGTHRNELLTLLIGKGADLDVQSEQTKMTPLILAVENGDADAMTQLLNHGANVNGANHENYSPLMAAAEAGKVQLVEILLARGADPLAMDYKGMTAQMLAQKNGHDGLAQRLHDASGES